MNSFSSSVRFDTLGCKLNFAETSAISQNVERKGFKLVQDPFPARYYVINTCSVTENADQKCKKLIRDFKKISPESKVIIIGCYAQLKPEEINILEGVDLVLGAGDKFRLAEYLIGFEDENPIKPYYELAERFDEFHPAYSIGERTRAFLKVQDGCDYSCSFCTIPLARGKSRNGTIYDLAQSAREIGSKGVQEIVLTGVNIGDFGRTTGESFYNLVQELDKVKEINRFRISSIEPNLLSSDIIHLVSESQRFMPHFHIPLQSGSNHILGLMRRRYRSETYQAKIEEILERIPFAGIGVDVIVGFPGETDEEFEKTYHFLSSLPVSYLHVFSYSERANTLAKSMPGKVSPSKKSERSKVLHALSVDKTNKFRSKNTSRVWPVLFERAPKDGYMQGFTPNYIKVEVPYNKEWTNRIIPVAINEIPSICI